MRREGRCVLFGKAGKMALLENGDDPVIAQWLQHRNAPSPTYTVRSWMSSCRFHCIESSQLHAPLVAAEPI